MVTSNLLIFATKYPATIYLFNSAIETLKKVRIMFQVNNKNTRKTSGKVHRNISSSYRNLYATTID